MLLAHLCSNLEVPAVSDHLSLMLDSNSSIVNNELMITQYLRSDTVVHLCVYVNFPMVVEVVFGVVVCLTCSTTRWVTEITRTPCSMTSRTFDFHGTESAWMNGYSSGNAATVCNLSVQIRSHCHNTSGDIPVGCDSGKGITDSIEWVEVTASSQDLANLRDSDILELLARELPMFALFSSRASLNSKDFGICICLSCDSLIAFATTCFRHSKFPLQLQCLLLIRSACPRPRRTFGRYVKHFSVPAICNWQCPRTGTRKSSSSTDRRRHLNVWCRIGLRYFHVGVIFMRCRPSTFDCT